MKFATIIKELREEKNSSQEQLQQLGISQSAIAKWELSKTEPIASMLIVLADFFKITIGQLLGVEKY